MNELMAVGFLLFSALLILVAARFGKEYVFAYGAFTTIVSNILFGYQINVFGMETTWIIFMYVTNFLAIDVLTEFYSKRDAARYALISMVGAQILFQIYLFWAGSLHTVDSAMVARGQVEGLFATTPRITIAAVLANLLILIDVQIYSHFKRHKHWILGTLWFRTGFSALVTHLVLNIIFFGIILYGVVPNVVLVQIILSNLILKYMISGFETPFMYGARWLMKQKKFLGYSF